MVELEKLSELIATIDDYTMLEVRKQALEWFVRYKSLEAWDENLEQACKDLRMELEEELEED